MYLDMTESSCGGVVGEQRLHDTAARVLVGSDPQRTKSSPTTPDGVRRLADTGKPAVLWIDDEKSPSDADIQLLEHEGFRIECAITATEGLALARNRNYQAILLDLRLPDIPGLSVLASLRAEKISTPVLVVTGFGDFESARVAGQLGVAGFQSKPVFVDDLKVSIEQMVEGVSPVSGGTTAPHHDDARDAAAFKALAALFETLHRLARRAVDPAAWLSGTTETTNRQTLTAALMRALLDPALPMPAFLACAAALKIVTEADAAESPFSLADYAQNLILEALGRSKPTHAGVVDALATLESAARDHRRLKGREIAKLEAVSQGHLSALVHDETGFYFTEWRSAYLLRPSLALLAESKEQVKQIACRLLGFSQESQFSREFKALFGVSPTEFRERCGYL